MTARPAVLASVSGWARDDAEAALSTYLLSVTAAGPGWPTPLPGEDARSFFETAFRLSAPERAPGLLTGYYEPEIAASLERDHRFRWPLHACPPGLGARELWHDRAAIEDGNLLAGLEIAWVADPLDAFLAQVQGSVRLGLADGGLLRLGYGGSNGHPYRSIGAELVARGVATAEAMTLDHIRDWAARHPDGLPGLLRRNPSYVFFRILDLAPDAGPVGALGQSLVAQRSLAADPDLIPPGAPVWVSAVERLMIAQDRGSAIRGPNRGDVFCGSGPAAGQVAGRLRLQGYLLPLLPLLPDPTRGGRR